MTEQTSINKSDNDFIPAYEGDDMLRYITEAGFKLYMPNPTEMIKSMVNIRDTAIIVTTDKIYRVRPERGIGFCIEVLTYV